MTVLDPTELAGVIGATVAADPSRGALGDATGHDHRRWPAGRGVAYSSAGVRPGDVFFALQGASGHGIDHAEEALARGAAYLVSDRPHPHALLVDDAVRALHALGRAARARLTAPVVAITGSAGKTTTKTLATHALVGRSTPGNLNTPPALVAALVEAALMDDPSTGASVNRGALAGPGRSGSPVVLELGIDRAGEMDELLDLTRPDHGLITTIGDAHLSGLGDRAAVAREKSRLLERAPGLKLATSSVAEHLPTGLRRLTIATHITGQTSPPTGVAVVEGGTMSQGGVLTALGASARLPWPGGAMADNALLALVLAARLGRDPQEALDAISAAPLEHSRLERLPAGDIVVIDDSYNSNPLSVVLALEVLRSSPGPHVAFLGDMLELGAVSRQRHLELGAATADLALVVAIGAAAAAIAEVNPRALLARDAEDAARYLDRIPAGATVLVKGSRSMRLERLVAALLDRFGADTRPMPNQPEVSSW